jgi:hypothetical protein
MANAGYSNTPLAKKLGLKPAMRVCVLGAAGAAPDYRELLAPWDDTIDLQRTPTAATELVHLFVERRAELAHEAKRLRALLAPDATLWVSWPKKAARRDTDITEDVIRAVVLPLGWVDVKVCAVDATWSGLKLVVRKELR